MTKNTREVVTVRDLMAQNPATLDRNETLDLPETIMNLGRIRHMPVVEDGKVVGVLSQRDMFRSALIVALPDLVAKQPARSSRRSESKKL